MLNAEQRAIYAKACMVEPLEALGSGFDPAKDLMRLIDLTRGNAVSMRAVSPGFSLTYFEIIEALRIAKPAQYTMAVEFLMEKYVAGGLNR